VSDKWLEIELILTNMKIIAVSILILNSIFIILFSLCFLVSKATSNGFITLKIVGVRIQFTWGSWPMFIALIGAVFWVAACSIYLAKKT